jgi:ABC-type uncharacterized transport system substrate-binding protein
MRWTVENSKRPDFSFWDDRVEYGTLCSVYVSAHGQGYAAGRIARRILAGEKPSELADEVNSKSSPIISLARANKLGLRVNSTLLLSTRVVTEFPWDKK